LSQEKPLTTRIEVNQQVKEVSDRGQVTGVDIRQLIGNVFIGSPDRELARDRRNRLILLDKVRSFWIEGVLERSLHNSLLIDLGKESLPDAVHHPWEISLETSSNTPKPIPSNTTLISLFEELGRSMLILGKPGSGKTITLLELARSLIELAEVNDDDPIPVVLHLSSWSIRQQPLAEWVVEEINDKYLIPKTLGKKWVEKDTLLYLLDGLDEVNVEHRELCVQAINHFREEHGLAGIVVCSRFQEYDQLKEQLRLEGAINLRSLTDSQVDSYLAGLGPSLVDLREALWNDTELRELSQSPLLLNILCLTYQDLNPKAYAGNEGTSPEERRQDLFNTYVQRMFERRGSQLSFSSSQTIIWLAWLARKMQNAAQSLFLVESLQPDWLPNRQQRLIYTTIVILLAGLPVGILLGFGVGYPVILSRVPSDPIFGNVITKTGLQLWLGIALASLVLIGLITRRAFGVVNAMIVGLAYGLAFGIPLGYFFGINTGQVIGLTISVLVGILYFLVGLLLYRRSPVHSDEVEIIDKLKWSWRRFVIGFPIGAFPGFAFGALLWWFTQGDLYIPGFGIFFDLTFGLISGVIVGVLVGFVGYGVEMTTRPNQGIRNSARNALNIGVTTCLVVGLPLGLLTTITWRMALGQSNSLMVGISIFLGIGLSFGLITGLLFGGFACVQHFVLRMLLYRAGKIPWHFIPFLDYAVERIFLQKVGGGYIFIHRTMLEYFANLAQDD